MDRGKSPRSLDSRGWQYSGGWNVVANGTLEVAGGISPGQKTYLTQLPELIWRIISMYRSILTFIRIFGKSQVYCQANLSIHNTALKFQFNYPFKYVSMNVFWDLSIKESSKAQLALHRFKHCHELIYDISVYIIFITKNVRSQFGRLITLFYKNQKFVIFHGNFVRRQ